MVALQLTTIQMREYPHLHFSDRSSALLRESWWGAFAAEDYRA